LLKQVSKVSTTLYISLLPMFLTASFTFWDCTLSLIQQHSFNPTSNNSKHLINHDPIRVVPRTDDVIFTRKKNYQWAR